MPLYMPYYMPYCMPTISAPKTSQHEWPVDTSGLKVTQLGSLAAWRRVEATQSKIEDLRRSKIGRLDSADSWCFL